MEGERLGESQGEFLRGEELYTREREAWKRVLGAEIEVKPLPEDVTPEVQQKLVAMGFGLRYIPILDLGSREELARKGAEGYLQQLWSRYYNWHHLESLGNVEIFTFHPI